MHILPLILDLHHFVFSKFNHEITKLSSTPFAKRFASLLKIPSFLTQITRIWCFQFRLPLEGYLYSFWIRKQRNNKSDRKRKEITKAESSPENAVPVVAGLQGPRT
jgi:hypothetical protein